MLTFDRKSSRDLLSSLKTKVDAFKTNPLNHELAISCAIDVWSLFDWVFKEHGEKLGFSSLTELRRTMVNRSSHFSLVKDLANAGKHKSITYYEPMLREAKRHEGAFDRGTFSSAFNVPALVIITKNGNEYWFDEVIENVVQKWEEYFDENSL